MTAGAAAAGLGRAIALLLAAAGAAACSSSPAGGSLDGGGGSPGGHTNPLGQDQIDAFVAAHNQARSGPLTPPPSPPLSPVSWDAALADVAFNYLGRCQGTSLVNHNANRTADYAALGGSGYVGENIYATTGTATPADAVTLWMAEASSYDYASGDFGTAGHYTQVVWRASVRIGCAIVDCPSIQYHDNVLCDYAPGGNIIGEKPY